VYTDLGVPAQYRVRHQIEQARLAGYAVQETRLADSPHVSDLTTCNLLYFYRLPLTSRTWPLYQLARWRRIPIIFDSDDLVWDERERSYSYLDAHYTPAEVMRAMKQIRRTYALMQRVDAFVLSTPYLAHCAEQTFRQPVFVNRNALSQAMIDRATALVALQQRDPQAATVIGYFCGTPYVHDEDLASIAAALGHMLARYPQLRLRIYGALHLAASLDAYAAQIEQRPLVPWQDLLAHVVQVDIAIAPLVDNPQRRAKSAVKYLEAALVAVPVVASRLEPYQDAIVDGVTGLLASTPDEWAHALEQLIQSPELRASIGQAARQQAVRLHSTAARAPHFAAILQQVVR